MSTRVRHWIESIGTVGHLARMIVVGLVGVFLITAAIDYKPSKAVGLDRALAKLAHQSYGPVLLGLVAAGLVAFGLYSLSHARLPPHLAWPRRSFACSHQDDRDHRS